MSMMAIAALFAGSTTAFAASHPVTSCSDLENITDATGTYTLTGNIDCTGVNFTPVSTFSGTLNGAGYTVSNLSNASSYPNYDGMFSTLSGATVEDLTIANVSLHGNYEEGVLAADAANGTKIVDVHTSGSITSGAALSDAGGIVGWLDGSTISYSSANINFSGVYEYVGGIASIVVNNSTISKSYSSGQITSAQSGGQDYNGGLVGELTSSSSISDSYSSLGISASGTNVAGLAGWITGTSTIVTNSYSTGAISDSASYTGGLIGQYSNGATTTGSYWDVQTSGISAASSTAGGVGTSTTAMKTQSTFSGWDFANTWTIATSSYPTLRPYTGTITQYSAPQSTSTGGCGTMFNKIGNITYAIQCGITTVYSVDAPVTSIDAATLTLGANGQPNPAYSLSGIPMIPANTSTVASNSTPAAAGAVTVSVVPTAGGGTPVIATSSPIVTSVGPVSELNPEVYSTSSAGSLLTVDAQATSSKPAYIFTRSLRTGSVGSDVKLLQQFLNSHGYVIATSGTGSAGQETDLFGAKTAAALVRFQDANASEILAPNGLMHGTGVFGPATRAYVNSIF